MDEDVRMTMRCPGAVASRDTYMRRFCWSQRRLTTGFWPVGPNTAIDPRSSRRYTQSPAENGQSFQSADKRGVGAGVAATGGSAGAALCAGGGGGATQDASSSIAMRVRLRICMTLSYGQIASDQRSIGLVVFFWSPCRNALAEQMRFGHKTKSCKTVTSTWRPKKHD